MYTNPDRISQLAREHHHQLLAQASQRHLAAAAADATGLAGRLAAAIIRRAAAIAGTPGRSLTRRPRSARPASPPVLEEGIARS